MGIYPQCALLFRQYDMKMEFYPLSDELAVAGQLRAQDMAQVAQAGFKSVVINRPDQEEGPWQPSSKEVIEAAQAAGMQAVYRSEEHTFELQSRGHLVCRLVLEK